MNSTLILAFGAPGWQEIALIAALGLLIFGRRLPEVGRSVGRTIVEFKKGLKGVTDEIDQASEPGNDKTHQQTQQLPQSEDEEHIAHMDEQHTANGAT